MKTTNRSEMVSKAVWFVLATAAVWAIATGFAGVTEMVEWNQNMQADNSSVAVDL